MKRSAFTMIELIFVIVILGVLAAVALPKFEGIKKQADLAILNAFVGTLNRQVGPSLWMQQGMPSYSGRDGLHCNDIHNEIEIPTLITTVDTDQCEFRTEEYGDIKLANVREIENGEPPKWKI